MIDRWEKQKRTLYDRSFPILNEMQRLILLHDRGSLVVDSIAIFFWWLNGTHFWTLFSGITRDHE